MDLYDENIEEAENMASAVFRAICEVYTKKNQPDKVIGYVASIVGLEIIYKVAFGFSDEPTIVEYIDKMIASLETNKKVIAEHVKERNEKRLKENK